MLFWEYSLAWFRFDRPSPSLPPRRNVSKSSWERGRRLGRSGPPVPHGRPRPARCVRGIFRARPPRPAGESSGRCAPPFQRQPPRCIFRVSLGLPGSRRAGRPAGSSRGGRPPPAWDREAASGVARDEIGRPGRRLCALTSPRPRAVPADVSVGCRAPPGVRFYIAFPLRSVGDVGKGCDLVAVSGAEFQKDGDVGVIVPLSSGRRRLAHLPEIEPPGMWGSSGGAPWERAGVGAARTGRPAPAGAFLPPPPPTAGTEGTAGTAGTARGRHPETVAPSVARRSFPARRLLSSLPRRGRAGLGRAGPGRAGLVRTVLSLEGKPAEGAMGPGGGTRGAPGRWTRFSPQIFRGPLRSWGPGLTGPGRAARGGPYRAPTPARPRSPLRSGRRGRLRGIQPPPKQSQPGVGDWHGAGLARAGEASAGDSAECFIFLSPDPETTRARANV